MQRILITFRSTRRSMGRCSLILGRLSGVTLGGGHEMLGEKIGDLFFSLTLLSSAFAASIAFRSWPWG